MVDKPPAKRPRTEKGAPKPKPVAKLDKDDKRMLCRAMVVKEQIEANKMASIAAIEQSKERQLLAILELKKLGVDVSGLMPSMTVLGPSGVLNAQAGPSSAGPSNSGASNEDLLDQYINFVGPST